MKVVIFKILNFSSNFKTCSMLTKYKQFQLNSFLASGDFCRLLITFANSLDPDQDQQNQSVPERFF